MSEEFSLGDFDDSGNFFFGIDVKNDPDFDLLINPYIKFFGYSFSQSVGVLEEHEIEYCLQEYRNKLVTETT